MTGIISNIQRFSLHDGPGARSTVFFKGCPLRCLWCHNPEMYEFGRELRYKRAECVFCGICVETCPAGALKIERGEIAYDSENCSKCFACASECPTGALAVSGREMTAGEVVRECLADAPIYVRTGGGVTLSGGEASAQFAFALALIVALKAEGMHVALDTCGLCATEKLMELAAPCDLVLFDLKHADPNAHRALTGADNGLILGNFRALGEIGAIVEARIPVIPGYNDGDENISAMARILAGKPHVKSAVLLGYHPLGRAKIYNFNLQGGSPDITRPEGARMRALAERMRALANIPVSYR